MENNGTYNSSYTGDDTIASFVTFCIEQYKNYKGILGEEAMERLSDAKVLEYLADNYEALHLESTHWILQDIDRLVTSKLLLK